MNITRERTYIWSSWFTITYGTTTLTYTHTAHMSARIHTHTQSRTTHPHKHTQAPIQAHHKMTYVCILYVYACIFMMTMCCGTRLRETQSWFQSCYLKSAWRGIRSESSQSRCDYRIVLSTHEGSESDAIRTPVLGLTPSPQVCLVRWAIVLSPLGRMIVAWFGDLRRCAYVLIYFWK